MHVELVANWNLLDSWQSTWFKYRIKLANKRGEKVIYSSLKARANVILEFEKIGVRIVNLVTPVDEFTWISW